MLGPTPGAAHGVFNPQQPLRSRQIGMLTGERYGERPLFDDKSAERADLKFDGARGGPDWKSKMETFLVYKCHMMLGTLEWAERHGDTKVTMDNFNMGGRPTLLTGRATTRIPTVSAVGIPWTGTIRVSTCLLQVC